MGLQIYSHKYIEQSPSSSLGLLNPSVDVLLSDHWTTVYD